MEAAAALGPRKVLGAGGRGEGSTADDGGVGRLCVGREFHTQALCHSPLPPPRGPADPEDRWSPFISTLLAD